MKCDKCLNICSRCGAELCECCKGCTNKLCPLSHGNTPRIVRNSFTQKVPYTTCETEKIGKGVGYDGGLVNPITGGNCSNVGALGGASI